MLYAHAALGHGGELLAGLLVEVFSDVFGRWIQHRKWLELVEHLMVDAVDDRAQNLLEQLEVQQEAGGVQLR
jgi:hypothetical protein